MFENISRRAFTAAFTDGIVRGLKLLKGSGYSHRIGFMTWYDVMQVNSYLFCEIIDVTVEKQLGG